MDDVTGHAAIEARIVHTLMVPLNIDQGLFDLCLLQRELLPIVGTSSCR